MSDHPSPFDLDDELLSAYLDNELTGEERAAIERRLASDPAARQMLDELRHVSQVVHNLPQVKVGRELRDAILQRVEAAGVPCPRLGVGMSDESSMPTQGRGHGTLPSVTIGRSMRGWVWASLAVAAALLIAVFVPDERQDDKLPVVAQRARDTDDRPLLRAATEVAPAETAVADSSTKELLNEPAAPRSEGQSAQDYLAKTAPAAAPATEVPAASAPAGAIDATAPALGTVSAASEPAAQAEVAPLVVVHVLANPDALKNGEFERLLTFNGIAVEPEPPVEQIAAKGTVTRRDAGTNDFDSRRVMEEAAKPDDVEMNFLVEAPPEKIMSCLAGLNEDSRNYFGVAVDEVAAKDKSKATAAGLLKKRVEDLSRYNRGSVPQRQAESRTRDTAFYYRWLADTNDRYSVASGGKGGITVDANHNLGHKVYGGYAGGQARARRLQPLSDEKLPADRERESGLETGAGEDLARAKQLAAQRGLGEQKARAPADAENLQVLFVLQPGAAPPASPPAENPPQ